MSYEKSSSVTSQTKQQRKANAKFYPWDSASWSNSLVALCMLWQFNSMLSNTGLVIIILYLWKQNDDAYTGFPIRSYAGNNLANYGGNPRDGYIEESNVPKQILSMGFISIFYLGLLILMFILGVIDLCLISEIARGIARSFRLTGLNISEYSEQQGIIATALAKLWVGAAVGSQSFIAFGEGNGLPQEVGSPSTWHGRFIVTLFVWSYCLNILLYVISTLRLVRRIQVMRKFGLQGKGNFFTHSQEVERRRLSDLDKNGNHV